MVIVEPTPGLKYYMDGGKKTNFDIVKKFVEKDWDMCWIYSGYEGAGKSTTCIQDAKYLDPTLDIDRICFSPEDFEEKIKRKDFLKRGNALVLDEGFILNARASMTEINRKFLSVLAECRQKNLFLFIVVPNFFDLDKNICLWRSRGLFYVYHKSMQRGYFKYFNYERKKRLYVLGKKFYNYNCVGYNLHGRFTKKFPIDEDEYKRKKLAAFEERMKEPEKTNRWTVQRDYLFKIMVESGISRTDIANKMNKEGIPLTHQAISKAIQGIS